MRFWSVLVFCRLAGGQSLFNLVKDHFRETPSYMYFCSLQDALTMRRELADSSFSNVRTMENVNSNHDILVHSGQPQRIGVFLDLNCKDGQVFLEKSLDLFNATYRWMVLSEDDSWLLGVLKLSRCEIDSDLTVLSLASEPKMLDVYRTHFTTPFVLSQYSEPNLIFPSLNRKNFNRVQLNVSTVLVSMTYNGTNLLEALLDPAYENGVDSLRRYSLALIPPLADYYNFTPKYSLNPTWGEVYPNGTWTGMVGEIQRGEAEIGTGPAIFYAQRYLVVDYIAAVYYNGESFLFLQPPLFGTYKALFNPLNPYVWLLLGICTACSIIAFRLVGPFDTTARENDSWGGSTLLVLAAIAQQGIPDRTERLPTRVIYIMLLFVTFFVSIYYNTAILNGLLLPAPNAITNFDQLMDSSFKFMVVDIPYYRAEMERNDSRTQRMNVKLNKQKISWGSRLDGLSLVKKGKHALYTESNEAYKTVADTFTDAEICSLTQVYKDQKFPVGVIGRDNSPFREFFYRVYHLMRERGIMDRQRRMWVPAKPACQWKQDSISIGIEPLALAYLIYIFGFIGSIIIWLLELRSCK